MGAEKRSTSTHLILSHESSPEGLELIRKLGLPSLFDQEGRPGSGFRGLPSMLGTPAPTCGIRVSLPT
jgi:hypothetical protein